MAEPDGTFSLIVNSDNTINIKPIKDSWSREEVIELLKDIASDANRDSDFSFNTNKWIEDNL